MQGKISLIDFNLEPEEMEGIYKLIDNCTKKLERNGGFESIKVELRKGQHGKAFLHEINAHVDRKKTILTAKSVDYNPYKALQKVLNKIINESERKEKK